MITLCIDRGICCTTIFRGLIYGFGIAISFGYGMYLGCLYVEAKSGFLNLDRGYTYEIIKSSAFTLFSLLI